MVLHKIIKSDNYEGRYTWPLPEDHQEIKKNVEKQTATELPFVYSARSGEIIRTSVFAFQINGFFYIP